jgi:hypothetical protein
VELVLLVAPNAGPVALFAAAAVLVAAFAIPNPLGQNALRPANLWIYGHTHHAVDVRLGRTRLLCNPYGYQRRPDEQKNGFSWETTVDV